MFVVVEKKSHLHTGAQFCCKHRAEQYLKEILPKYVTRGYLDDKSLAADDFEIIERQDNESHRRAVK